MGRIETLDQQVVSHNNPDRVYEDEGWAGYGDWLGTGNLQPGAKKMREFNSARTFVHSLGLLNRDQWRFYCQGAMIELRPKPDDIPNHPNDVYKDSGWAGMGDWLGTHRKATRDFRPRNFEEAREFVRSLKLKNTTEWRDYCKGNMPHLPKKPDDIPAAPWRTYSNKGWKGVGNWLGTNKTS